MKTRLPTSRSMRGRMTRSRILAATTVAAFGRWMTNHRLRLAIVTFSEADERFRAWLTDGTRLMPYVRRRRAAQRGFRMGSSYPELWSTSVGTGTWKMSLCRKRNRTVRPPSVRHRTATDRFEGGRCCRWSARIVDIAVRSARPTGTSFLQGATGAGPSRMPSLQPR
jgi:hypothetical protein